MNQITKNYEDKWEAVLDFLKKDLKGLRSNRATPALIEDIMINYYETMTPLKQISTISTPEPRQLLVDPWDKNSLKLIESEIQKLDKGFGINNDGQVLRISLPQMTEETRKDTVNILHAKMEEARVGIRKIREEILKKAKQQKENSEISEDDLFRIQKEVQDIVDKKNEEIKNIGSDKEREILTV